MALFYKSVLSLRIMGDDLIPEDITSLMNCKPTLSFKKGDAMGESGHTHNCGRWSIKAQDCEPEDINGQVEEVLSKLTQDLSIWQTLSKKYDIDIFCGLFMQKSNGGLDLYDETLSALANRGIEIGFDIYSPD